MAILDSFKIDLGFIFNEKKAKKFTAFIGKAARGVKKLSLAFIGLASAVAVATIGFGKQALQLSRFAKVIGTTRKEVEKFRRVGKDLTGDSSVGQGLISNIAQRRDLLLARGEIDSGFQEGLNAIGLNAADILNKISPTEMLIAISEALSKTTDQANLARFRVGTGFDVAQETFLNRRGETSLKQLLAQKKMTNANIKGIEKLGEVTNKFSELVKDLANQIGVEFGDDLVRILEDMKNALPDAIIFLRTVSAGLSKLANFLGITEGEPEEKKTGGTRSRARNRNRSRNGGTNNLDGKVLRGLDRMFENFTLFPESGDGRGRRRGNSGSKTLNQNNTMNIQIDGAKDPASVKNDVISGITDAISITARNFENEVIV